MLGKCRVAAPKACLRPHTSGTLPPGVLASLPIAHVSPVLSPALGSALGLSGFWPQRLRRFLTNETGLIPAPASLQAPNRCTFLPTAPVANPTFPSSQRSEAPQATKPGPVTDPGSQLVLSAPPTLSLGPSVWFCVYIGGHLIPHPNVSDVRAHFPDFVSHRPTAIQQVPPKCLS